MRKSGYYRVKWRGNWGVAHYVASHHCWFYWQKVGLLRDSAFDEINEDPIDPDPASEYDHDFKPA